MIIRHPHPQRLVRGFSLLEVLIATMILGIGLIMIASIFPVGADWTRQATEESIAQNCALNAVALVKTHYSPNLTTGAPSGFAPDGTIYKVPTNTDEAYYQNGQWLVGGGTALPAFPGQRVYCLPNFPTMITVSERAYQVGGQQPSPVPIAKCQDTHYFWTALMKVPDDNSRTITLYILVFRRGDRSQFFTEKNTYTKSWSTGGSVALSELSDCRNVGDPNECDSAGNPFTPSLWKSNSAASSYSAGKLSSGQVVEAWPNIGSFGIGLDTGTVFRQTLAPGTFDKAAPSVLLYNQSKSTDPVSEDVITSLNPTGWPDSPLIYVYQTQLSF